jgi:hypothetical protein
MVRVLVGNGGKQIKPESFPSGRESNGITELQYRQERFLGRLKRGDKWRKE